MRRDLELKRFGRDLTINVIRLFGTTVIGLLTSVIISRSLGPEGRGAYALALLLPQFLFTFVNLGTFQAIIYYVAREREKAEANAIVTTGIALTVWLSILGMIIGYVVIQVGGNDVFPNVPLSMVAFGLLVLPLQLQRQNIRGAFRGYEDFRADGSVEVLFTFLNLVLLIILVWVLDGQVWGALWANLLASILVLMYALRRLSTQVRLRPAWRLVIPDPRLARQLISFGLRVYLAAIAGLLLLRVDVFLLNLLGGGAVSVGIYAVGVALAERLNVLLGAVRTTIYPRISSWDGHEDRRSQFTTLISRHTLWLSLMVALGIALAGDWVVRLLYGEEFAQAADALIILLPGLVFYNQGMIIAADTGGRGKPGIGITQSLLALVVNIIANLILIPRYDLLGAALASTIAYMFMGITWSVIFCRLNQQPWQSLVWLNAEDRQRLRRLVQGMLARLQRTLTPSDR